MRVIRDIINLNDEDAVMPKQKLPSLSHLRWLFQTSWHLGFGFAQILMTALNKHWSADSQVDNDRSDFLNII